MFCGSGLGLFCDEGKLVEFAAAVEVDCGLCDCELGGERPFFLRFGLSPFS